MLRILLFILTNLAIIVLGSITLSLLGFEGILQANGVDLNLQSLLLFCAVFGFAGAFISLLLSKPMAKWSTKTRIITDPKTETEHWLVTTVERMSRQAGISTPEIGIFPANVSNAFATGWNKNAALVAVSEGLLSRFSRNEVEAIIGHEIAHVANGDMVTLTLVQGVVNTFVMFLARVIGFFVDRVMLKNERGLGIGYYITTIICEIILGILATTIVCWFSRKREFAADAGGAKYGGRQNMILALERLKAETNAPNPLPESMQAFAINQGMRQGFSALFATHPPLDQRIKALKQMRTPG